MIASFLPIFIFFLAVGAFGGWARRAIKRRFEVDLIVDVTGICALLILGTMWTLTHPDTGVAGTIVVLLTTLFSFLVVGAFTLGNERISPFAWLRFLLLSGLVFGVIAVVFLASLAAVWPPGESFFN